MIHRNLAGRAFERGSVQSRRGMIPRPAIRRDTTTFFTNPPNRSARETTIPIPNRSELRTRPSGQRTHRSVWSTRRSVLSTHRSVWSTHRSVWSTHRGMSSTHRGMSSTHRGMSSTHRGMSSTHRGMQRLHPAMFAVFASTGLTRNVSRIDNLGRRKGLWDISQPPKRSK